MNLGILGGTFNPIHLAHLRLAEEVREVCALDRVLFIPAATPPHKAVAEEVSFSRRLAMVEAAIADNPYFAVSDLEGRRSGKSYSVHTLELLRTSYPADELYFIIGQDSFCDLSSWREYPRLFELAHLVVVARPGVAQGDPLQQLPVAIRNDFCYDFSLKKLLHRSGTTVIFLQETLLDISSTAIRRLVTAGRSVRYLVPPVVESYLVSHGLYRGPTKE